MRFSRSFGLSLVYLVTFGISWERAFPVWLRKVSMELRFIPRQRIKKQRHYLADKGSYSQSCGFPSSSSSSVTQSCPTLCDPMNCSTPGLPVHHNSQSLPKLHWVGDHPTIQPSHPLSSPSPPALNLSQYQGLFEWVSSVHQVAKVLEFQLQHQSF